jgi:Lrp/AsnC family transcriptional regulator for asnA, asnC and gidA
MYKIDEVDRKIIKEIERDIKVSYQKIAEDVGVSLPTIYNRIKRLRRLGIIETINARINYKKLGYGIYALIGIVIHPKHARKKVLNEIADLKQEDVLIHKIYEVTGRFDVFLEISLSNIDILRDILDKKFEKIREIQGTETFLIYDSRSG